MTNPSTPDTGNGPAGGRALSREAQAWAQTLARILAKRRRIGTPKESSPSRTSSLGDVSSQTTPAGDTEPLPQA